MRYPAYPAITPRITQRSPSREGPRAGLETRERSDEEKMAFSGGARWLKISRERSEAEEKIGGVLEARWRDWRLIFTVDVGH